MNYKFLVTCLFLAFISQANGFEVSEKQPPEWSLRITKNSGERDVLYVINISCYIGAKPELVIKKGAFDANLKDYKTLYVGYLTKEETSIVWDAFAKTLRDFRLVDNMPRLDGGFVSAELAVGTRSLQMMFSSLVNTKEASPELEHIIEMADARLKMKKEKEGEKGAGR